MGVLRELFSRPLHGRNGTRGDAPAAPPVPYAGPRVRNPLLPQQRANARLANHKWKARQAALPPEQLALMFRAALAEHGPMTRTALANKFQVFGPPFDAATAHGAEQGWLESEMRSNHPKGGGPTAQFWRAAAPRDPTPAARYWLQAPPGGAQLNGRPYRAGQFVPGTTMFQHTPRPYGPLDDPGALGGVPQPDGTTATPAPPTAALGVAGAPQTAGGAAMFPAGMAQPGAAPALGAPGQPQLAPGPIPPAAQPQMPSQPAPGYPQTPTGPADAHPGQPVLQRSPWLPPDQQVLEQQSQVFAQANFPALRDLYFQSNAVLDPVSGDVRSLKLSADGWNQLLPGYTGGNADALAAAAGFLDTQLFNEALRNQAGKGNNRFVTVAGGDGFGDGLNDFHEAAEYPLVADGAPDYNALQYRFEAARAAGMQPEYVFVDRPAGSALGEGVERALRARLAGQPPRARPLAEAARANQDARRTALSVLFGQPDVAARVVDDHGGARFRRRMLTDRGQAAHYLAARLLEDEQQLPTALAQLRQSVVERQRTGEIPADLATALLGEGWEIRPPRPF